MIITRLKTGWHRPPYVVQLPYRSYIHLIPFVKKLGSPDPDVWRMSVSNHTCDLYFCRPIFARIGLSLKFSKVLIHFRELMEYKSFRKGGGLSGMNMDPFCITQPTVCILLVHVRRKRTELNSSELFTPK